MFFIVWHFILSIILFDDLRHNSLGYLMVFESNIIIVYWQGFGNDKLIEWLYDIILHPSQLSHLNYQLNTFHNYFFYYFDFNFILKILENSTPKISTSSPTIPRVIIDPSNQAPTGINTTDLMEPSDGKLSHFSSFILMVLVRKSLTAFLSLRSIH